MSNSWRVFLKRFSVAAVGFMASVFGAWLRLSAKDLAWPTDISYTGSREATEWAIKEHSYQDLGLISLVFGLALLLVVLAHWLWKCPEFIQAKDRMPS